MPLVFSSNATEEVKKGCKWLVEHRLPDGGWGENFESCEVKEYVPAEKSQTVNTAWALLGLMAVRSAHLLRKSKTLEITDSNQGTFV